MVGHTAHEGQLRRPPGRVVHYNGSQVAWTLGDRWCGDELHGQTGGSLLEQRTGRKIGKAGGLNLFSPSPLPWETCQRKQKEKYISSEFSKANVLQKTE